MYIVARLPYLILWIIIPYFLAASFYGVWHAVNAMGDVCTTDLLDASVEILHQISHP